MFTITNSSPYMFTNEQEISMNVDPTVQTVTES